MTADPAEGGSTDPAVGVHTYTESTVVNISATPAVGYDFDYWTGDVADPNSASTTVTMDDNKTVTANFELNLAGTVTVDGAASSSTADDVSSINISHTTGTGADRLMLVGVSWNCGTTDRSISSVVFNDGTDHPLTEVITQQAGTQLRYSAIYSLPAPPSGTVGTVTVNFSGSVSNGIVAGSVNFAGVDQTTPLGTPDGAGSGTNDTAPSVTLTGLDGDELVFDNVFQGASGETQTLTAGADQTQLWNAWIANVRAAASTEQATSSSVTMSWTASSAAYWAIAAVPINPAAAATANGLLRVQTDPAVPTTIFLDGIQRDDWGLNWVKLTPGSYMLSFSDVYNFNIPETVTVNYYPGTTGNIQSLTTPIEIYDDTVTEVSVNFIELGNLRVQTDPAMPATIYCDGVPMDDWAFWTNILPGQYTVSFEDIDGYITPAPQVVTVNAGQTTSITGTYVAGSNPVSPVAHGLLRVQTDPAVPTTIFLDGIQRDDWGLNWVKLTPGSYMLSFSDVYNFNIPETVTVNYYPGTTGNIQSLTTPIEIYDDTVTEVIVNFIELGNLRVETVSGGIPPTIYCDGVPMDDWAFWTNILPGEYTVSFETLDGKLTPPPLSVVVAAGATTHVIGNYDTGQTTLQP
jgi:uncharacterized repeat protein (TIGR02543 family)